MLSGTLITAAGFLPIATAKSTPGEYTFGIFAVTTLALVISWFAAVIATPFLGSLILREHRAAGEPHELFDTPFYRRLRALVDRCIHHRRTVIAATAGVLVLGLFGMTRVQQQFFPLSERPELFLQMRLPAGSSIGATDNIARRAEALLKDDPDIGLATTYVGGGILSSALVFAPDHAGRIILKAHLMQAIDSILEEQIKTLKHPQTAN